MKEKKRLVFSIALDGERKVECVYINSLSPLANLISYVVQYIYGTGNILDENFRRKAQQSIKEGKRHYFFEADDMAVYLIEKDLEDVVYTYHREPTQSEIAFGYGATHYLDIPGSICLKKDGLPKKWLINPMDGLRYYR